MAQAFDRDAGTGVYPISIKGVVVDDDGHVLLGRNDREEWELLGGRIEECEHPSDTLRREIFEESGLVVDVDAGPVEAALFDVWGDRTHLVFVVTFRCFASGSRPNVEVSDEHEEVRWHTPEAACVLANLPSIYKTGIKRVCFSADPGSSTTPV